MRQGHGKAGPKKQHRICCLPVGMTAFQGGQVQPVLSLCWVMLLLLHVGMLVCGRHQHQWDVH
jgi:hypothetical protein